MIEAEEGDSILVSGPAKASLERGEVELFGKRCTPKTELKIPYGKCFPLISLENCLLKVITGSMGEVKHLKEKVIPVDWYEISEKLKKDEIVTSVILGEIDVGKSSLATFLTNKLTSSGFRTAVIDLDIGQSDIGPPGVIGLTIVKEPLVSLTDAPLIDGYFIGDNTPTGHLLQVIVGASKMVKRALEEKAEKIIVNTSGMVYGSAARVLKEKKIEIIEPGLVIVLQREKEIEHLVSMFKRRYRLVSLTVPRTLKRRSREQRYFLRTSNYLRQLKNQRILTIKMDETGLKETSFLTGRRLRNVERFEKYLGTSIIYGEESSDCLLLVSTSKVEKERIMSLQESLKKEVKVVTPPELQNLYLGLENREGKFIGVGLLKRIDFNKGEMQVLTSSREEEVGYVTFGYLKISEKGEELLKRKIGSF